MAAPQQHIIGRQILEIDVPPGVDPYEVQERTSYAFRTQLMPRLAELFDQITDPDTVIQIDRLEIDLGSLPVERLEKALEEEVLARIEGALYDEVRGFGQSGGSHAPTSKSQSLNLFEAWLHFLDHGYLPWQTMIEDWGDWEKGIVKELDRSSSLLNYTLRRSPHAIDRLVRQFSLSVIQESLRTIKPGAWEDAMVLRELIWHVWPDLSARSVSSDRLSSSYWSAVFDAVLKDGAERSFVNMLVHSVLDKVAGDTGVPLHSLALALYALLDQDDNQPSSLRIPGGGKRSIKDALWLKISQGDGPRVADALGTDTSGSSDVNEWEGDGVDSSLPELSESNRDHLSDNSTDEDIRDDLFISNAGLVLLHPYLELFFGHLGLVKQQEFVDPDIQQRCVLLLQYLASGNQEARETDLVLNKILCGLPVATPVDSTISLTDQEIAESESLLNAIINHWSVLKNTSPDGLRYNFIMREGKLSQSGMGWKLIVDRKAHDILLNNLPWGFSTIKLPWMQQLIQVEWNS